MCWQCLSFCSSLCAIEGLHVVCGIGRISPPRFLIKQLVVFMMFSCLGLSELCLFSCCLVLSLSVEWCFFC